MRIPRGLTDYAVATLLVACAAQADEPTLPSGLGGGAGSDAGAADDWDDWDAEDPPAPGGLAWTVDGFGEARAGLRLRDDDQKDASIAEARGELGVEAALDRFRARTTVDLVADAIEEDRGRVDLETGEGFVDLREAWISLRGPDFLDTKIGRQILTWGTGDLLFVNDLFPKDWVSFFVGRDTEYLKAPSDAAKFSFFSSAVNLDLVYTPRFDADRYIDGSRISFYNPAVGGITGRSAVIDTTVPDDWFSDDELAARLYATVEGIELALYGYRGFWKSPAGADPATGRATFPALSVIGASARGPAGPGLANGEVGFYLSEDDESGTDPLVRNSEFRALVGYEQEIAPELGMGLQLYLEWRMDHDDFIAALPPGADRPDEVRTLVTLRLTQRLMQQRLSLGIFAYVSPNELDTYLRPHVGYRIDDHWSVEGGANLFYGKDVESFFGQFQRNSNVYTAVRYAF